MKYVLVIVDGLGDVGGQQVSDASPAAHAPATPAIQAGNPRPAHADSDPLDGRTPLEMAVTPVLDDMATNGRLGRIAVNPSRPGAALATVLAVLGAEGVPKEHDPKAGKRSAAATANSAVPGSGVEPDVAVAARSAHGWFAALGQGIPLGGKTAGRVVCTLSFMSEADGEVTDPWLDDLSDAEAKGLMAVLAAMPEWKGWDFSAGASGQLVALAPSSFALPKSPIATPRAMHGQPWQQALAKSPLEAAIRATAAQLAKHDINRVRVDLGMNPANLPWIWGAGQLGGTGVFAPAKDSGIIQGQRPGPHAGTALGLRLSVVSAAPVIKGAAQWLGVPVVSAAEREPAPLPEPETNPWPHPGDVSVRRKPVGEGDGNQRGAATWAGRELGPVPAAKRQAEAIRLHGDLFRSLANSARVALETADVVVVHTSVVDAVSARRRRGAKRLAVEQLDEGLLGPLIKMLRDRYDRPATGFGGGGFRIAVVASSVNDSRTGRHVDQPAPLAMWGTDVGGHGSLTLTEANAARAEFGAADASGLLTWMVRGL